MLTIDDIKGNGWLIFETVMGSRAYGLDTPTSDTDIRGVYVLPKALFYSLDYVPQVSNETNDIVYYELRRFIELLSKNNPNIMEMLNVPDHCVLLKHALMGNVKAEMFLSRLCEKTFANYAFTQIKKAYGLEKKFVNPVEKGRKSVLDFCFVRTGKKSMNLSDFLAITGYSQEQLGLSAIPHMRDCYNLYYSANLNCSGVTRTEDANDVCQSNIPKNADPIGLLYFNKDGYSVYCKRYKEYWEWVENRNEERYNTSVAHGKNYDSKNMMHVFRLLLMAREIAIERKVNVHRKDRDFLLSIKQGKYEYDELVEKAEALKNELPSLYESSSLPDEPDLVQVNKLLIEMRSSYYKL